MIDHIFTTVLDGNIAYHVNDDKNSVTNNRLKLQETYDINVDNLRYMNQTHGCNVEVITHDSQVCIDDCDGLITAQENLPLMVMVADCIPILIQDENKKVIAAVHAGRNSTFLKIVQKTVLMMIEEFNCKVEDIKVNLGPSIQKCCYEVSEELVQIVKTSFGQTYTNNRLIDLQGINSKQLIDIGVLKENISTSNICTKCSNKNYFSYRLDKYCGRFAGIITIK